MHIICITYAKSVTSLFTRHPWTRWHFIKCVQISVADSLKLILTSFSTISSPLILKVSKFSKYVHKKLSYLEEVFQNGDQKWVSYILRPPCTWQSKTCTILSIQGGKLQIVESRWTSKRRSSNLALSNILWFAQLFHPNKTCLVIVLVLDIMFAKFDHVNLTYSLGNHFKFTES